MISRRNFLKAIAASAVSYPSKGIQASTATKKEGILNAFNIHTGESLNIIYYASGRYDYSALREINYFLRYHYTNKVETIDIKLIDLLSSIQNIFGVDKQLQIISDYRSISITNI